MSDVASRWAFEQRVSGLQKPVLMALGFRHNGITGACFPSVSTIAEDAGFISDDSVRRALKGLSRAKLLTIVERWDGPNRLSNSYTLHFAGVPAHSEGVPAVCEGGTRTEQGGYSLTAGRVPAHSDPNKEVNKRTQQGTEQKRNADRGKALATLLLKGKGEYLVCEDDLAKHQRAFPTLDIQSEYRRMELWCADNPSDRKTESGIHRFMSGWLTAVKHEEGSPLASLRKWL